uniref:Chemokine interleukin-8-like domain-containing protein n=1 Tax=Cyprinus carpio TaxID=7962 RepID=A0A8C1M708_CYPCA
YTNTAQSSDTLYKHWTSSHTLPRGPGIGIQRCLCHGDGLNMVKPKLIEKIEIHPISPSCKNLEVVVTLKNNEGRRCLNTESLFTKFIIDRIAKKTRSAQ